MKLIAKLIFTTFLFVACSKHREAAADMATTDMVSAGGEAKAEMKKEESKPEAPTREKKIIRNANLRFEVKNHDESLKRIDNIVKQTGGYIVNSVQNNGGYSISSNLTIRINADKLDTLIAMLEKESVNLEVKSIKAEDVTAQFIDTEARLKSKRELESRYLDLLKKANNVKDILEIENQLNVIREEIEAKEGVLKYLNDQVAYSTVELSIYERTHGMASYEEGFFSKIWKGLLTGWDLLLDFIVGLFNIWPFIIITTLFFIWFRNWRKKRRSKNE